MKNKKTVFIASFLAFISLSAWSQKENGTIPERGLKATIFSIETGVINTDMDNINPYLYQNNIPGISNSKTFYGISGGVFFDKFFWGGEGGVDFATNKFNPQLYSKERGGYGCVKSGLLLFKKERHLIYPTLGFGISGKQLSITNPQPNLEIAYSLPMEFGEPVYSTELFAELALQAVKFCGKLGKLGTTYGLTLAYRRAFYQEQWMAVNQNETVIEESFLRGLPMLSPSCIIVKLSLGIGTNGISQINKNDF